MSTVISSAKVELLELKANHDFATRNHLAVRDVVDGTRLLRLAWTLGWLDIRLRYRGSMLGPFWLTLSTGIMVAAMGYLYSNIFHTDVHAYLPYLSLSLVLWGFLSTIVTESCNAFTESEGIIRAVRMPLFMFPIRVLIRNTIVLAHNIVVIVVVFALFRTWPGLRAVLAIPGLLLWGTDALAVGLLLGTFCSRFRDILPVVGSVMQIAFFITPVFWQAGQLGAKQYLLRLNPVFDLLDIVRPPLIGAFPGASSWVAALLFSLILWGLAWGLFVRARGRITFWI